MKYLGFTYTKRLFVIYLKFEFPCVSCIFNLLNMATQLSSHLVFGWDPLPGSSSRKLTGDRGETLKYWFSCLALCRDTLGWLCSLIEAHSLFQGPATSPSSWPCRPKDGNNSTVNISPVSLYFPCDLFRSRYSFVNSFFVNQPSLNYPAGGILTRSKSRYFQKIDSVAEWKMNGIESYNFLFSPIHCFLFGSVWVPGVCRHRNESPSSRNLWSNKNEWKGNQV